ncbi:MAG TPA: hypothetical protein VLS27_13555, partial [Gammaproteobacteria bacterium]|nr:hypothetical protein [Gammaproteobacteria bacterium]
DHGRLAATSRYVLNLGPIDLSRRGTKTFKMMNLPETSFVIGIEIIFAPQDRATIETQAISSTVLLKLSGVNGQVLFMKKSELDKWTWSKLANEYRVFIYGRSENGTYFQPQRNTEYALTISVLEPDPAQVKHSALLLAKSGGWK